MEIKEAQPTVDGKEIPFALRTEAVFGYPGEIPQMNDGVWIYMQEKKVGNYATDTRVPTLEPGTYTLAVSLGDAAGVPMLNLPLANGKDKVYPLGKIQLQ